MHRARILLIIIAAAALALPLARAGDPPPDFAGALFTPKFAKIEGKRKLLAILWNQHGPYRLPSREEIDARLFGPKPSVADWYRENSGGKLTLERAGVLGWYDADFPGEHYWPKKPLNDAKDSAGTGWLYGDVEKWTEAIRKAAKEFKFSDFDANHDGVLTPDELGILIVIPKDSPFGTNRTPAAREVPKWEPLVVDGVRIPVIAEWYTGDPPSLGAPAHELSHLLLGAPDLYHAGPWPFAAGDYSIMDNGYSTAHLDAFEKLKHGWLKTRVVTESCELALRDIETTNQALILYDPLRGPGEYFLIENRWRGASYDAGVKSLAFGIPQDGLCVWHVLEDPALQAQNNPPSCAPGDWGRRALRLIRRNGGEPADNTVALFGKRGELVTPKGPALRWLDGSRSRFKAELLTDAGPEVRLRVTVYH